jgi:hypothetical protein
VAKVGTSNQDRTISLKAAVRSCINKPVFILKIQSVYCEVRTEMRLLFVFKFLNKRDSA